MANFTLKFPRGDFPHKSGFFGGKENRLTPPKCRLGKRKPKSSAERACFSSD